MIVGAAVEPRHQRRQFALHFEHDLGAGRGEKRHVARELDRIAETLLGVQQHGLARQRIFAEPQRPAAARCAGMPLRRQRPSYFSKPRR